MWLKKFEGRRKAPTQEPLHLGDSELDEKAEQMVTMFAGAAVEVEEGVAMNILADCVTGDETVQTVKVMQMSSNSDTQEQAETVASTIYCLG